MHYLYYSNLISQSSSETANLSRLPHLLRQPQVHVDSNPFPPVDTKLLINSAENFQKLLKEADKLVEKISTSPTFSYELMNEAQLSNAAKVDKLIKSTGISVKVETTFTPAGIHIRLDNGEVQGKCCQLTMLLHW